MLVTDKKKKTVKFLSVFEIRESWFSLFFKEGYSFISSSSLVPSEDNSLLFINSGVSALKKYFRNSYSLPSRNLVNCQLAVRLSDIDRISNWDSWHQTMFEMLGSFSIGGNFKKEVIPLVWKWLVSDKWLNLEERFLFVTVWKEDRESYEIWRRLLLSFPHNIFLGSREENFWDMGDGPCGPNTEIYYGLGISLGHSTFFPNSVSDLDNKNFVEIGNIVFPEFDHKEQGYESLLEKCVDIGMGLERIAMIKQKKRNIFSIDLWQPIVKEIKKAMIS